MFYWLVIRVTTTCSSAHYIICFLQFLTGVYIYIFPDEWMYYLQACCEGKFKNEATDDEGRCSLVFKILFLFICT